MDSEEKNKQSDNRLNDDTGVDNELKRQVPGSEKNETAENEQLCEIKKYEENTDSSEEGAEKETNPNEKENTSTEESDQTKPRKRRMSYWEIREQLNKELEEVGREMKEKKKIKKAAKAKERKESLDRVKQRFSSLGRQKKGN